jgi:ATP-dependent DNA helicase PIF1
MTHRHVLEAIDRLFQDLMKSNLPFGGKIFVLGGDFRQTLPVLVKGSRGQIVDASLRRSKLWKVAKELKLTINERVRRRGDSEKHKRFAEYVLQVGNGSINDANDFVEIPPPLLHHGNLQDLLLFTQPNLMNREFDPDNAVLCSTNEHAEMINNLALDLLGGSTITVRSTDSVKNVNDTALYPVEFLNSLNNISGLPPHELKLREGVPIMLLRNLSPRQGLCNGTRLRVLGLRNNVIQAQVISGPATGNTVLIPRIAMSPSQAILPFELVRRQLPIKVAFALTINKAQGQTLKRVGIYLPKPVFTHGQYYVSVSRSGDPDDVRIMIVPRNGEQGFTITQGVVRHFTKNIVYKEVFT